MQTFHFASRFLKKIEKKIKKAVFEAKKTAAGHKVKQQFENLFREKLIWKVFLRAERADQRALWEVCQTSCSVL